MARTKKYRQILAEPEFNEAGVEYVGNIDELIEAEQEKNYSAPAVNFSNDKDNERDLEYMAAARRMMYSLYRKETETTVQAVLDILHKNNTMQLLLCSPAYLKLADRIIKILFMRKYNGLK